MIIGLVLCGLVAVLLFFGIAERVFKSFGVAYWLAFVIVGVLIGCAFIPTFEVGVVSFNIAGFFAPLLFAAVFFYFAVRMNEGKRALVTALVAMCSYISVSLLVSPVTGGTVTAIVVGFLCGAVCYLVGKTRIAALCGVFLGMPLGEPISSAVSMYVYGSGVTFGTPSSFDAVIIAAVLSVAIFETVAAVKRAVNARAKNRAKLQTELAEEFDAEEYKKYFDE